MNVVFIPGMTVPEMLDGYRDNIMKSAGPDSRIMIAKTREDQVNLAPEAEVVLGTIVREAFVVAKKLRVVQTLSAGVDTQLYPEFVQSDVQLISDKGMVGDHLSEHAFGLMLALTRNIARIARDRAWIEDRAEFRNALWELTGRTMGIIGLGGTGLAVAKRADVFNMRVIAMDPEPVQKPAYVAELMKADRFHDLLGQSDVVTICAPLTKDTKNLFDLKAFQAMKRTAYLINVTRGEIVDEQSVVQALQQGLIAGAGLDVTPREPMPPDSPLWKMDNVLIGCHTAGASPLRAGRTVDRFCRNLVNFREGKPLEGVIDKIKQY